MVFLVNMCLHFHSRAPSEPPLAALDLCLLGLIHEHFRGRALSHLAVLTDTSLGWVTNTALNEPASLLWTKHLLPLDQSRGRRDLMSHLAHEAHSWNYAKDKRLGVWMLGSHPCPTSPGHFQGPGASEVSRPIWDNQNLTELPHSPWVRVTVIFVAENVESHGIFTALHPASPPSTPQ